MKIEWEKFLIDAGAEFNNDKVESFGNPSQERSIIHTGDTLCDLSHYGLISACGADAVAFLQGQFTNDVAQVNETHSQLSSYCNPKGRMLANFRIFKRDETLYLSLPYSLLEAVLNRLRMYVMRSKVTLEDASDALVRFGLNGPKADNQLKAIAGLTPENVNDTIHHNGYTIIRVHGTDPRYEIYGELNAATQLWQSLDVNATAVGSHIWELLNIQSGIPVITASTYESFVPQMANMSLIGAINFKKGCYTGQEIVARMHYLGTLKKRMYRISIDTNEAPKAGDKIFAENSTAGTGTGTIVSVELNADDIYEALAVIQIADAESQTLKLHDANGPVVKLLELPY
ncbi:MAG: folate-binding protein YgfZ, partial [Gammaproteobacteria bacterium]|nr:folate-binding protein YgfZ [Gammaproteobacteria bacterium]